jgi:imidazolonepropionase-like amidohydrolase
MASAGPMRVTRSLPSRGTRQSTPRGACRPRPRIYPSQAAISQTAGHGDFGFVFEPPTALGGRESRAEQIGFLRVADGADRVLAAVREQLKLGASQIKLMAGGGVASLYDPLYTLQFTPAELRAAVEAAADYGTYVATHVYNVAGIHRAVEAGVKSIEHGHLADEPTVAMLAERDVWLSTQPFSHHDHSFPDPDRTAKDRQVCDGTEQLYRWAKKHGVKTAWGTDLLFEPDNNHRQSEMVTRLGEYFTGVESDGGRAPRGTRPRASDLRAALGASPSLTERAFLKRNGTGFNAEARCFPDGSTSAWI